MKRGISLRELNAIWRTVRRARMTDDRETRARAKVAAERGARELLRLCMLLDEPAIGRRFASTRDARCSACSAAIAAGDAIAWLPRTPICSSCVSGTTEEAA